jgi:hypothetical protein
MRDGDIVILRSPEVRAVLAGRELELIEAMRTAYETHGDGDSSPPHSTFLTLLNWSETSGSRKGWRR